MFANLTAIETLVSTDAKATEAEKEIVLAALKSDGRPSDATDAKVISIADAARCLGKQRKSVYHLLRNGTLKGFYSGKTHARATGITRQSLEDAVSRMKGTRK